MLQVSVTSKHAGRHVTLELLNWFLAQVQTSIPQWQADDTLECEVDCCGTCWSCTSVRNANNRRPTEAGGRRKKMLGTLCKYNTGGKGQKWSHVRRTCRSISTADFMKKKRLTRLFCLEKFQICFYEPHIELFGCFSSGSFLNILNRRVEASRFLCVSIQGRNQATKLLLICFNKATSSELLNWKRTIDLLTICSNWTF